MAIVVVRMVTVVLIRTIATRVIAISAARITTAISNSRACGSLPPKIQRGGTYVSNP